MSSFSAHQEVLPTPPPKRVHPFPFLGAAGATVPTILALLAVHGSAVPLGVLTVILPLFRAFSTDSSFRSSHRIVAFLVSCFPNTRCLPRLFEVLLVSPRPLGLFSCLSRCSCCPGLALVLGTPQTPPHPPHQSPCCSSTSIVLDSSVSCVKHRRGVPRPPLSKFLPADSLS